MKERDSNPCAQRPDQRGHHACAVSMPVGDLQFGHTNRKTRKTMPKTSTQPPDLSYEQALQALESLVQRMDSGELPLDGLLEAYQQGTELLKLCRDRLSAVEAQVQRLDNPDNTAAP